MRRLTLSRIVTATFVMLAATTLAVPNAGASGKPARCDKHGVCAPPAHLKWSSPTSIADGVPARFSSGDVCPNVRADGSPLQGTREVAVFVTFPGGGGVGDIGPVATDGSWSFSLTFDAGGTHFRHATVTAMCVDVTDTGIDIADYRPHHITVNP